MGEIESTREISTDPMATYAEGLAEAKIDEAIWTRRSRLASNARLFCFASFLIVAWLAFGTRSLSGIWVALPALAFVALVIAHDRILRREERAIRIQRFFEGGIARLENRWAGLGNPGDAYRDPNHPYAEDLDLFGAGSLFELLATTRTTPGSDRLAGWLLEADEADAIRRRQAAVAELRPRLDLRLRMALAGDEASSALQQEALEAISNRR